MMGAAGLTFRSLGSSGACWAPRRTIHVPPFEPMTRAPFEVAYRPRGPIRNCAGRSLGALPWSCLPLVDPSVGGRSSSWGLFLARRRGSMASFVGACIWAERCLDWGMRLVVIALLPAMGASPRPPWQIRRTAMRAMARRAWADGLVTRLAVHGRGKIRTTAEDSSGY